MFLSPQELWVFKLSNGLVITSPEYYSSASKIGSLVHVASRYQAVYNLGTTHNFCWKQTNQKCELPHSGEKNHEYAKDCARLSCHCNGISD
uniref:Uncharacterized protein n=1 Tax=Callorhinchus milii TaxID=7868 RepID=A0A4W3IQR2_CALMI